MGRQIIRQPDGLYSIFSSVVDAFVIIDATPKELEREFARIAARDARLRAALAQIESNTDAVEACKQYSDLFAHLDEYVDPPAPERVLARGKVKGVVSDTDGTYIVVTCCEVIKRPAYAFRVRVVLDQ